MHEGWRHLTQSRGLWEDFLQQRNKEDKAQKWQKAHRTQELQTNFAEAYSCGRKEMRLDFTPWIPRKPLKRSEGERDLS